MDVVFKGVYYEMTVMVGKCEWIIHSTEMSPVGSKIGMKIIPFNIQIMNKLFLAEENTFYAEVVSADESENYIDISIEDSTIRVDGCYYEEGARLMIQLPPKALSIAGDGVGDLNDVYIESVIFKGEHNEIILESDEQKWLMQSDVDEQVATYVPLKFDFTQATIKQVEAKDET